MQSRNYDAEAKRQTGLFLFGMAGGYLCTGLAIVLTPEFQIAHQFGWIVVGFFAGATTAGGVASLVAAWISDLKAGEHA